MRSSHGQRRCFEPARQTISSVCVSNQCLPLSLFHAIYRTTARLLRVATLHNLRSAFSHVLCSSMLMFTSYCTENILASFLRFWRLLPRFLPPASSLVLPILFLVHAHTYATHLQTPRRGNSSVPMAEFADDVAGNIERGDAVWSDWFGAEDWLGALNVACFCTETSCDDQ